MRRRWLLLSLIALGAGPAAIAGRAFSKQLALSPGPVPPIATVIQRSPWPECPPAPESDLMRPAPLMAEAAAYGDVLTHVVFARDETPRAPLFILSTTTPPLPPSGWAPDWRYLCHEIPELDLTALRSFRRYTKPEPLRAWFALPVRYQLFQDRSSPTPSGRWVVPDELRGGHFVSLSRMGFSNDFSQALVYVEERQEKYCAEGYYLLLRRYGSFWRPVQKLTVWIT